MNHNNDINSESYVKWENILLHTLFEDQAYKTPSAPALLTDKKQISYGQLNNAANHIGARLRDQGALPEMLVAVVMEKGWEQIVAILGILKSGAAYLPVDPELPFERYNHLMEVCNIDLALTTPDIDKKMRWTAKVSRLIIEEDLLNADRIENDLPKQKSNQLAYVLFTSGSTGEPKGVMINHCGAVNTIMDINKRFAINCSDRVLALSAFNFDLSVYDIFGLLAAGGALVLPDQAHLRDPMRWGELAVEFKITLWNSVPALFQLYFEYLSENRQKIPASLKTILLSGDWLPLDLVPLAGDFFPEANLVNLFGVTEASIWSLCYPVKKIEKYRKSVPIGKPMHNQQAYILDENLKPCPAGKSGKLYFGGDGVALGYWGDTDKTNTCFITYPLTGERIYCTGDLARYYPDGLIEYLGRSDNQVKINGHRIELGEIDYAINKHKAVKKALTAAVKDKNSNSLLVSWVILNDEQFDADKIKEYLLLKLPRHMVPSCILFVKSFPLSRNGKVNLKALPCPGLEKTGRYYNVLQPRNKKEKLLLGILHKLSGVIGAGITDNFFELGCDSIQIIQFCLRARTIGCDFSYKEIFHNPSVMQLMELKVDKKAADENRQHLSGHTAVELTGRKEKTDLLVKTGDGIEAVYPLSPMQETIFLHSLHNASNTLYTDQVSFTLTGNLDQRFFCESWQLAAQNIPCLRTLFSYTSQGNPIQIVYGALKFPVRIIDLSACKLQDRDKEFSTQLIVERKKGFNPEKAPLMRILLVQMAMGQFKIIWTHHHIILDGWSLVIIMKQVLKYYNQLCEGAKTCLPQAICSRADYFKWLNRQDIKKAETFWREELRGFTQPPKLAFNNYGDIKNRRFQYGEKTITLVPEEVRTLKKTAARCRITLNSLFLGAWAVLLNRCSGVDDIIVGVTTSGRPADVSEIDRMAGLFINTLPLRLSFSPSVDTGAFLKKVLLKLSQIEEYGYLPLHKISRCIESGNKVKGLSLFENIVVFENFPIKELFDNPSPCLKIQDFDFNEQIDMPLALYIFPGSEMKIRLTYNENFYERNMANFILSHLKLLLLSFSKYSGQNINKIPLITDEDRIKIGIWNDNETTSQVSTIIAQFESLSRKKAYAPAVIHNSKIISYGELNRRANQLAHYLKRRQLPTKSPVIIFMERSIEMIISLLAVWKAGCAYVPVEAPFPASRLEFIVSDSDAQAIITTRKLSTKFESRQSIICLDCEQDFISREETGNLKGSIVSGDLAYIIYTSGSAGKPRGVMIEHGSLAYYTAAAKHEFDITEKDRILQFASLSFDAAAEEIFTALTGGAALYLRTQAMAESLNTFLNNCDAWGVTILDLPTAFWHELMFFLDKNNSPGLPVRVRLLIIGGEKAMSSAFAIWKRKVNKSIRLLNTYGPTETTVVCTICDLTALWQAGENLDELPIGVPLANSKAYIVDESDRLLPVGMTGELCISGPGVARGYVNDPEMNSGKFYDRDIIGNSSFRLYRTGDLVRYRPDGLIEFVGRKDRQVKHSGFRIEPAEIEEVIMQHKDVKHAVVLATNKAEGEKQLIAYIISIKKNIVEDLQAYLKKRVANYMVPSAFVFLDKFPLNRSGKIDKRLLPLPAQLPEVYQDYIAPGTATEKHIANVWSNVLNKERISIDKNFCTLGGDSLKALNMISQLENRFKLSIDRKILLENSCVAELAAFIERQTAKGLKQ